MRHERLSGFTAREREALLAVATAIMPPGKRFPGADERCVRTFEGYLRGIHGPTIAAARAMLRALDAEAYARRLRPFARLSEKKRRQIL